VRVVWSQEARADIRAIHAYRSRFSRAGAGTLLKTLRSRALQLQDFPDSGRLVPEMNNPYMRELIEGDYRILYTVDDTAKAVQVYRIKHRKEVYR